MFYSLKTSCQNFTLKLELMEGVSIIETQKLSAWEHRLENIEQMLLTLIKVVKDGQPGSLNNNIPDFISISEASKKYKLSRTSIYNKINLFCKLKGRDIDRLQTGAINRVNEVELIEAIKIKGEIPKVFRRKT